MNLQGITASFMTYLTMTSHVVFCDPGTFDHGVKLPTNRPLNIAHRGSSGTHPEHTEGAYKQAIRDGADVIECDVYVTKDKKLVCLHDSVLSANTDIKQHREFGSRKQILRLNSEEHYDWFCFDFTLQELKTLRVVQNKAFRDPKYNKKFSISTLEEYIEVAKNADRPVGIYPELKHPAMLNSMDFMNGTRVEDLLLEVLEAHGYTDPDDPCFIQSYGVDSLKYLYGKTNLSLVVLIEREEDYRGPTRNETRLEEWAEMFYGVGAWKNLITLSNTYQKKDKNWIVDASTELIDKVHALGMKIHLYTFRNEDVYLAWDFGQNPVEEYKYFMKFGIDGYFTDFPKTFNTVLRDAYEGPGWCDVGNSLTPSILSLTMVFASVRMLQ